MRQNCYRYSKVQQHEIPSDHCPLRVSQGVNSRNREENHGSVTNWCSASLPKMDDADDDVTLV
jgi:hypothetical protein